MFLFQNALRAVVESHSEDAVLPNIDVLVVKGKEDLTIKVTVRIHLHSNKYAVQLISLFSVSTS